jgi:biotin synthase
MDSMLWEKLESGECSFSYSREEIRKIYDLPFPKLLRLAGIVHSKNFSEDEVQLCTLMSIKTGGCKEDCGYCPQSAHHSTEVEAHQLLDHDEILQSARDAKEGGATRFCMGAAWRSPPKKGAQFNKVLDIVRSVHSLGLEVCTTLGMLDEEQAVQLKEAGVHAYNHNLDTSPEYYGEVISTRTYADRLTTLSHVRNAGMTVCCGGIVGLGEAKDDRIGLLEQLNHLKPHPESVPINLLVKVEGTPLANVEDLDIFDMVRTIAVARIIMPISRVRLSAGRKEMSDEAQALCFVAGANSIFTGEKLLTTANPELEEDLDLLKRLGMKPQTVGDRDAKVMPVRKGGDVAHELHFPM